VSLAEPSGRFLSLEDREEIAIGIAAGETDAQIARRIERSPATISRELVPLPPTFASWATRR
jgi:IS30 family transposase